MTLVVSLQGRRSVWLVCDRRLSFARRAPIDYARKVVHLDASDGRAIMAYAGLGRTAGGTEPSDWICGVLRNTGPLSVEDAVSRVADAAKRVLPPHLQTMPGLPFHAFLITAIVSGRPVLYDISMQLQPPRRQASFAYRRHAQPAGGMRPPRVAVAGSGQVILHANQSWRRPLLRLVSECERGRVSHTAVAQAMASLNAKVAGADDSVGPRSIVSWTSNGDHPRSGHLAFNGPEQEDELPLVPTISRGVDIGLIVEMAKPGVLADFEAMKTGAPARDLDLDEINAELRRIHVGPVEKLK